MTILTKLCIVMIALVVAFLLFRLFGKSEPEPDLQITRVTRKGRAAAKADAE